MQVLFDLKKSNLIIHPPRKALLSLLEYIKDTIIELVNNDFLYIPTCADYGFVIYYALCLL